MRHDRIGSEGGLRRYLQAARDALLKLDGLPEYDIRRPMTPTGTNLLGLVKHLAGCELTYFGDTFGRLSDEPVPWFDDDAEPNADMWATADESREQVVGLYRRAWAHSDATIVRELIDGAAGLRADNDNLASGDQAWWDDYRRRLQRVAEEAGQG